MTVEGIIAQICIARTYFKYFFPPKETYQIQCLAGIPFPLLTVMQTLERCPRSLKRWISIPVPQRKQVLLILIEERKWWRSESASSLSVSWFVTELKWLKDSRHVSTYHHSPTQVSSQAGSFSLQCLQVMFLRRYCFIWIAPLQKGPVQIQ